MIKDDELPDDRNPLAFIALSIIFAVVGIVLFSFFLFLAVICFFIAIVWFATGYAQWKRLKEEARDRIRF